MKLDATDKILLHIAGHRENEHLTIDGIAHGIGTSAQWTGNLLIRMEASGLIKKDKMLTKSIRQYVYVFSLSKSGKEQVKALQIFQGRRI